MAKENGQLIVVSKDLSRCVEVPNIAGTLQQALDNWQRAEPQLKEIYLALNEGNVNKEKPFQAVSCESPLPRAYQWLTALLMLTMWN